jgi:hypothetical protein
MLRYDVTRVHPRDANQVVEDTARWSPCLAAVLANFPSKDVFRDGVSGAVLFGPQPQVAPLAFEYVVFGAAQRNTLQLFEAARRVTVPQRYREVLLYANGLRSHAIHLFGIPSPANASTGMLDHWLFQPLQLEAAQHSWRLAYRPLQDEFMMGSLFRSAAENGGLFYCGGAFTECFNGNLIHYDTLDDAVETALARWRANAA